MDPPPCPQHGLYQLPTPTPGPQWSNSRALLPWQHPPHRAPPLGGSLLVQGGVREGLSPLGGGGVGVGVGRRSDPAGSHLFSIGENGKSTKCCSKGFSVIPETVGEQRWCPGLGTRETPRKPLSTLLLENNPIERSETRGFRMGDGRSFPWSPLSNAKATQGLRDPAQLGLSPVQTCP